MNGFHGEPKDRPQGVMMTSLNMLAMFLALAFLTGCSSIQFGDIGVNSHYIYPNSTIKKLGEVKAEYSRFSYLIPPSIDLEDGLSLYDQALSKKPGADLLIDYRIDGTVRFSMFPFLVLPWYYVALTVRGMAADMEIKGTR